MTLETLLTGKGREIMSDRTAKYLEKHAGEITPLVAECSGQARRELGMDASADSIARRSAVHLLKRIGHLPVKAVTTKNAESTKSAGAETTEEPVKPAKTKGAKSAPEAGE